MKRKEKVVILSNVFRAKVAAFAVASCFAGGSHANPNLPKVISGSATFQTLGKTLNVTNTPGAVIQWQGFSIGADEITRFIQQSASSSVLNRVVGGEASNLLGQLLSNGKVFLINPNGVFIGGGAIVDTAGFVASSLRLSDGDFHAGKFKFEEHVGAAKIVKQFPTSRCRPRLCRRLHRIPRAPPSSPPRCLLDWSHCCQYPSRHRVPHCFP